MIFAFIAGFLIGSLLTIVLMALSRTPSPNKR